MQFRFPMKRNEGYGVHQEPIIIEAETFKDALETLKPIMVQRKIVFGTLASTCPYDLYIPFIYRTDPSTS